MDDQSSVEKMGVCCHGHRAACAWVFIDPAQPLWFDYKPCAIHEVEDYAASKNLA
jgi:hypothetical protein